MPWAGSYFGSMFSLSHLASLELTHSPVHSSIYEHNIKDNEFYLRDKDTKLVKETTKQTNKQQNPSLSLRFSKDSLQHVCINEVIQRSLGPE